ncbi:aminotransferase class V-fold PLP-dependent enzyme [Flavihumibacter profundi]|uniref:aminotransferase class V-fold PLP-dependent enzyme n=1 Tax=Flavihumibacter profundi TaxID=2716883 RepID=UPI001CC39B09|nr:aminotransferase class V-fold PLP-dependent enzyme [Flavihumibacter profundi]MBZ5859157.1 aminotransferase class V-fold PLP-dependent enzyme [Flavihumibacter profundi]
MSTSGRRKFLTGMGKLGLGSLLAAVTTPVWSRELERNLDRFQLFSADELAGEEDFWYAVQQSYTVSPSLINLNNGGVSPSPRVVQEAMKKYLDLCNEGPSYYMWRILDQGREPLRRNLAQVAGCDTEEIAIQRNASEALETVIFGLPLKAGDEVVLSKQDYPNMINAWKQRELRDGIKLVWINLELPSEDNSYLVGQYTKAFTDKTKVVHITHIINWNGQILPVRAIADAAHARGIDVLVDGAHSFAHFKFTIPELGADYFGTSLHKWLSACIGSGLLYVKKEKIAPIFPFFASGDAHSADIRKFESLGTRPFFIEQATGKAIEFHQMIGAERKEQRLLYLKNYWMNQVKDIPGVTLGTSMKKGFGCAIGLVSVKDKKPADLENHLFNKYKIHTVGIEWENIKGVRITPHVYTTPQQLDILVEGIKDFTVKKF